MTTDTSMVLMVFTATMCTAIKKATIMRISSATATAKIMRISMGISTVIVTIMDTDTGRLTVMAVARRGAAHAHSISTADAEPGMDAHARAHAREIEQRFASGHATNGQILVFGLTGGLIPCPASITVLLLCLQLKQVALGATLVLSFSVGLALTMVASGVLAAWSVGQATKRWSSFGHWAARAPYISTVLMLLLAFWMAGEGLQGLQTVAA